MQGAGGVGFLGRRKVPHRGHDVHPADPVGGNGDGDKGNYHAQAVGDNGAARLEVAGKLEVIAACSAAGEYLVDDAHNERAGQQSQSHADDPGHQRVCRSLEDKHLDEMPSLGPDSPGHAQLGAPGRRQHHENQENQQDADDDGEQAEEDEETGHQAADFFRRVQQAPLDVYYHEFRQGNHQRVDLAGELRVAGCRDRFQESGANILIGEKGNQFVAQLRFGQFRLQEDKVSSRRFGQEGPLLPLLELLHDFRAGQGFLEPRGHFAVGEEDAQGLGDLLAQVGAAVFVTPVGYDDGIDKALPPEQFLGLVQVQQQGSAPRPPGRCPTPLP